MLLSWHTRIVMSGCERVLALSFREIPSEGRLKVVPPLIRKDFRELTWMPDKHHLVYLLGEGFISRILAMACEDPGFRAHVFSELPEDTALPEGISLHAHSQLKFLEYMGSCKALVTTAGFDSIAEAAYLGIPLGVIPMEGHFEQWCNARDVERSKIGMTLTKGHIGEIQPMEEADRIRFRQWVDLADELIVIALGL
jgi:uncharacterized protein (TIGR00661 family)